MITLGEEHAREILIDIDLETVEQLNRAMLNLDVVSAEEKAAVMLEFARFFYHDKQISTGGDEPPSTAPLPGTTLPTATSSPSPGKAPVERNLSSSKKPADKLAILRTLEKLRQRLDSGKIDWGKAGYDSGEGFKGPEEPR